MTQRSFEVERFLQRARGGERLPLPGSGETPLRMQQLRDASRRSSSVGRLLEAHEDGLAILAEAGGAPPAGQALAVWASGPAASLRLQRRAGRLVLTGGKSFCGGANIVDSALVVCESDGGEQLVLVDLHASGVVVDPRTWRTDAFADAGVCSVEFDHVTIAEEACIGPTGWYGSRAGFWTGAIGVGALWAGIADALWDRLAVHRRRTDAVADVATGTIRAAQWSMDAVLSHAAASVDADVHDPGQAMARALACRHAIRTHIEVAMRAFDQEVGPGPYISDPSLSRLRAELLLALGQDHGQRDLAALGGLSG